MASKGSTIAYSLGGVADLEGVRIKLCPQITVNRLRNIIFFFKNKAVHCIVFLPQTEDFVVGSGSGDSVLSVIRCVESEFLQKCVCMEAFVCSSCMFLILPEPSHDPSIRD